MKSPQFNYIVALFIIVFVFSCSSTKQLNSNNTVANDFESELHIDRKHTKNPFFEESEKEEELEEQDEYDIFGLLIKKDECQDCKLGHHEEHCYTVIKKFCQHCKSMNKEIANCKKCKNVLEHCDKPGHCEN